MGFIKSIINIWIQKNEQIVQGKRKYKKECTPLNDYKFIRILSRGNLSSY